MPPQILSQPQVDDETYTNEPVTLSVKFQSRFEEEDTLITWYKDGSPIPESRTDTQYGTPPNATTSLQFSPITRSDRGTYKVVVENPASVIPEGMRQAQAEFTVQVSGKMDNLSDVEHCNTHMYIHNHTPAHTLTIDHKSVYA